jgi:hypothetical protein
MSMRRPGLTKSTGPYHFRAYFYPFLELIKTTKKESMVPLGATTDHVYTHSSFPILVAFVQSILHYVTLKPPRQLPSAAPPQSQYIPFSP